uniref:TSA: Wollemia nobilis Ref_Wollemi_Transcript_13229_2293 transcribed RNA sequence n=1 Tax=Wollemia nobilis TaxID=56998 RepID=A0A0C9RKT2_9CONI
MERPRRKSASSLGFTCKKPLRLAGKPSEGKCTRSSTRAKNQGVALSVKDVIAKAKQLHNNHKSDNVLNASKPTSPKVDLCLPEKYAMLAEFFDCMEASTRLLGLRRTITSFCNVCPQVESMTHRRFAHSHLGQMKHILPQALLLEKIMVQDEKTLCMKPDLKITLLGKDGQKLNALCLRKEFRAGLLEFAKSHPQGEDVPEAILPEPFNRRLHLQPHPNSLLPRIMTNTDVSSSSPAASGLLPQPSVMSSLLPSGFQRRFSQKSLKAHVSVQNSNSSETSQNLEDLTKAEELACSVGPSIGSPLLKAHSSTVMPTSDQSQTPCKSSALDFVSEEASVYEETPCIKVSLLKDTSSVITRGNFSPATPGVSLDCEASKIDNGDSSARKMPVVKDILKSQLKSPISKKSLRFTNVASSPDTSSPSATPRTPCFALPKSPCLAQSSEQKVRTSNARRSIAFNRSGKNSCYSPLFDKMTPAKRVTGGSDLGDSRATLTESCMIYTPVKLEGTTDSLDSVKPSPFRAAANPFSTPTKNTNAITSSSCSFLSPAQALRSQEIQNENTMLSTPPLHTPKRRRFSADECGTPQVTATGSCLLSPKRSCIEPHKPDFDKSMTVSEEADNGRIGIHQSFEEGINLFSRSEWEILRSLSPQVVQEVREREIKSLEECKLGLPAAKRRQQMIAFLPKLFNMIRDIFRTCKRSVITQQELVHKIISNHTDITDRSK